MIIVKPSQRILLNRLGLVVHERSKEADEEDQKTENDTNHHKNNVNALITSKGRVDEVTAVFAAKY